jgi:DNA repair exonuclease SbcCD ATPase subunit
MSTAEELAKLLHDKYGAWSPDVPGSMACAELRRLAEIERQYLALKESLERMTQDRDSWEQQASARTDDAVRFSQELAALKESIGEPVAWAVYVAEAQNFYVVDSIDDQQVVDDLTNHNAVVTPLYAIKDKQP